MARLAQHAQVFAGIVLQHDRHMNFVLTHVLQEGGPARELCDSVALGFSFLPGIVDQCGPVFHGHSVYILKRAYVKGAGDKRQSATGWI